MPPVWTWWWCWCWRFSPLGSEWSKPYQLQINTTRLRQIGLHFVDVFKGISWKKMCAFQLRFHWRVHLTKVQHSWVQILAWRRPGDKPLYESMMVSLLTCVPRPQWIYCMRTKDFDKWHFVYHVRKNEVNERQIPSGSTWDNIKEKVWCIVKT